ncbi:hypothetical protein B0H21DRAFT_701909, partial [Amylocystis lapponica]
MLLWISQSLSPQDVRDRILADSTFRTELIAWLEGCHRGDFATGTSDDIASRVPVPGQESVASGEYRDPVTTLPRPPPVFASEFSLEQWYASICRASDEIVYLSNRHDPTHGKGCLRGKDRYCRARFPRPLQAETEVDMETGALQFKKTEVWINTYNIVLLYLVRCNSDITCLLSGTQVRAVVAYITDYITKSSLKTHTIFETIRTV